MICKPIGKTMSARIILPIVLSGCSDYTFGVQGGASDAEPWLPPVEEQYAGGLSPADACDDVEPTITEVAIDESCNIEPVEGELDAEIEWEINKFANFREYSQSVMSPMVGQLNDDNGDGVVDQADIPDIVIISDDDGLMDNEHGIIRIITGNGEGPNQSNSRSDLKIDGDNKQVYPYRYSNVALGEVAEHSVP